MRIVASFELSPREREQNPEDTLDSGETWRLVVCPACKGVSVGLIWWVDFLDVEDEYKLRIVYPARNRTLTGLPTKIDSAYDTALKVRSVDSNAFAVLLGRVLDMVCLDKLATGSTLYERLNSLAERGDIPPQLADMTHQLRQLRNIGAHADLGELTPAEVPVLDSLCRAILEYVYTAPQLVEEVERRLQKLKRRAG
jgi:hypothetical protein